MSLRVVGTAVLFLVVWLVAGGRAPGQEPKEGLPAGVKRITSVEGITEYRLENGLRVLLFPDHSQPTVTVNMTVLVGSRHEGYGETGMAHLLEHMVFKGTPTHPNVPKALNDRGARWNGTTWTDRTNYFETLPASDENLEWAIRFEADRLVNSHVRAEDLATEMTVVRNEFESGENSPQGVLEERMLASAYLWHNYGKSTIGNRSDIERVPIANLQGFYRKFYQPDNAILIVAGRFDPAQALAQAARHFGAIPRPARRLENPYTEEPPQDGEREVTLRRVGKVGVAGLTYHIPAGAHPDYPALDVLSGILTGAPSGRLYRALVETKKATRVSGSAYAWHDPGVLVLMAQAAPGASLPEVREILTRVVEEIAEQGVTAEELERSRREILVRRERSAANTSRLAVELSDWAAQGDWRLYFLYRDRVEQVTAAAVKEAAAKYLRRSNRTVGLYLPTETPERVAVAPAPDLEAQLRGYTGRAALAEAERFDPAPAAIEARVRRLTLPGGIRAVLLPKKSRGELVELRLTLRYGDLESLRGMRSAADLLPRLMNRGTLKRSYQELRDELDRLNTTLTVGSGFGGRGGGGGGSTLGELPVTMTTRRANLPAALALLREVLREPALAPQEFELVKQQQLASLERMRGEPQSLAGIQIQRALSPYPADDERSTPTLDDQVSRLQAVTLDQVRRLYEQFLGAQAGELVVVGDFEPEPTLKAMTEALQGWKAFRPYARIDAPARPGTGARHVILTPDKANAVYQAGMAVTVRDDHPDYPALVLADTILGGPGLSSRLGERLRQKEGLSYGASSSFSASAFHDGARLRMSAIYNPANAARVETGAREELERLVREGVTDAELEGARNGYLQRALQSRASDAGLARQLGSLAEAGRTMAYEAEFERRVQALTARQVSEALRRHVDPKRLVVVIAGDFPAAPALR